MRRGLVPVAIAVAAVLALYVAYAAWRAVGVALDESRLAEVRERAAELPQLEVGALPRVPDTMGDFVERPLFWADRRPPAPQDEQATDPAAPEQLTGAPEDLQVTGVVKDSGEWFAVAQHQGRPLRLREGDTVGGWQVTRIMADNIAFTAGGREYRLDLFREIKVQPAEARKKAASARKSARRAPTRRDNARKRALLERARRENGGQDQAEEEQSPRED